MNLDLMKSGLQPVIIKAADRLNYYVALDKAHTSNQMEGFLQLVIDVEEDALHAYQINRTP